MNAPVAQLEPSHATCESCRAHRAARLQKLGVNIEKSDYVVALPGNPNTGKSTVFNALTGLRQHTGNWPGKTVTRAEGGFEFGGKRFKLIDLPGTYSLLATSADEEVTRDFILFAQPDVTVIVVDAARLERNLNLVLQILEITGRVAVCLNLIDEARGHGIEVDHRQLARDLGVPVVPTSARYGEGLPDLVQTISDVATGKIVCHPHRLQSGQPTLTRAVAKLAEAIESAIPGLANARWVALRLLAGDEHIEDALRKGELAALARGAQGELGRPEAKLVEA